MRSTCCHTIWILLGTSEQEPGNHDLESKGAKKAMGLGTWLSFVVVKDFVDGILGFLKFCNFPGEGVF